MTNTELPRRSKTHDYKSVEVNVFYNKKKRTGCYYFDEELFLIKGEAYDWYPEEIDHWEYITSQECADEIIQLMTDCGLTPDEMLIVIEKVRQKLNLIELTKMGGENESERLP